MRNTAFAPVLAARVFVCLLASFLFTACGLLWSAPSLAGETIVFDGSNPGLLQPNPLFPIVPDSLFPGTPASPGFSGNSVSVTDGNIPGDVYGGIDVSGGSANVTDNIVNISGGTIDGYVSGGSVDGGDSIHNKVTISGGTIGNAVGGESNLGNALNNTVNIIDGTIDGSVRGGSAGGDASGNTVTISGGTIGNGSSDTGNVYGGRANNGDANGNTVTISNGEIGGLVFGGSAASGDANGNTVIISDGDIGSVVSGGSAGNNASGNTVIISGGTIGDSSTGTGYVSGGSANNGDANGNTVTIYDGDIGGNVYGGMSFGGDASGNTVTIYDGDIGGDIYGGSATSGDANGNTVTISGGDIGGDIYGGISGSGSGDANGNTVTISGGIIGDSSNSTGNVFGGFSNSGDANGNVVNISNGEISGYVFGGFSGSAGDNAIGNVVNISGGNITDSVYGAFAAGDAIGNTVHISGGEIDGPEVYGGLSGDGDATYNTVILEGQPVLKDYASIQGGFTFTGSDVFTGNTLELRNIITSKVGLIANFENYNFILPNTAGSATPMLAADQIFLSDTRGSGKTSSVNILSLTPGGQAPRAGDSFVLLRSDNPFDILYTTSTASAGKGISLLYDFNVAQNGNDMTATVTSVRVNPRAKSLAEGKLAGLAFTGQGADLIAGPGMYAARGAGAGLNAFAVGQGGASRYDTGSHVDVDGFSLMTGLAWNAGADYGKLLLGAFFEAGWGSYDSHNSFSNYASVKGDGDISYYGGGILGRFDFTNFGPGHFYAETSGRMGNVDTDFTSGDLRNYSGEKADYDSDSLYYGLHAGLGYVWNINEAAGLDFYTKYFWTRQDSDSVNVAGDPIRFKSIDSHRWRTGTRFSYAVTEHVTSYIGAAYEHEFDGKARATAYGYGLDAPDLKGGTGLGELGLTFKPVANCGLSLDLAVQGYTGMREGVSGSFQLKFEF